MSLFSKKSIFIFQAATMALTLWMIAPGVGFGDVFTWTDEKGVKHFSNIAPPAIGETTIIQEHALCLPQGFSCRVIKVYDGDTIRVTAGDIQFKVRLSGIDTPELKRKQRPEQPFAKTAKQALVDLVLSKQVVLKQHGTGSYNRVLAEVFLGPVNINLEMLKKGMAEVYQGKLPGSLDASAFRRAQAMAKKNRIGIWSLGKAYQSPKKWRKK